MNTSEQIDALVTALAAARPHYTEIPKNRTVTVRSDKGSYEFSYGTLDKILEATCPALAQQGIVPVFGTEYGPGGELWVLTRLYHTSGQWMETALNLGRAERTQDIGSRLSYGKRYGISALLAVQADDDVDAEPEATTAVKPRGTKATPAASQNGKEGTPATPGAQISQPPPGPAEPPQDRPTVLGLIMDALKALMPADASVAEWRKTQGDLQQECFNTRSWKDVQTKVKPAVLAEGLATLQAKVAALQPPAPISPAPGEDDVPDGLVPGAQAHATAEQLADLRDFAVAADGEILYRSWCRLFPGGIPAEAYPPLLVYCQDVADLRDQARRIDTKALAELDGILARDHRRGEQASPETLRDCRANLANRATQAHPQPALEG